MMWDDELEELTAQAFAAFGDEALGHAFVRAVLAAPALGAVPEALQDLVAPGARFMTAEEVA